jgi:hypothetical protein
MTTQVIYIALRVLLAYTDYLTEDRIPWTFITKDITE